jgi:hypothetical protein
MFYASNKNYKYAAARVQRQLNQSCDWMAKWRIKLNAAKSVAIIFGTTATNHSTKLTIEGQEIDWSPKAKYLGVTLQSNISMNAHVKLTIQKARGARAALYPVLNSNSPLPLATRLAIYKIYIRPILLYAAPVWRNNISPSTWRKIEAIQNIALRTITGAHYLTSNHNLRRSSGISSLQDEALHLTKSFAYRMSLSKFPHLNILA